MSTGDRWTRPITVRWADVDANGHMRNTAYSEFAADARMAFLAGHGFQIRRFHALGIAPVALKEELTYRRECTLGDELEVGVAVSAMTADASYGRIEHEIRKANGEIAAIVRVDGGWLSVDERELIAPPDELADVMRSAPRTADFAALESNARLAD
jgi:acyl-CoA thioester hydrolase